MKKTTPNYGKNNNTGKPENTSNNLGRQIAVLLIKLALVILVVYLIKKYNFRIG